jgi:vitamin K-dependent gamma-carboxylase
MSRKRLPSSLSRAISAPAKAIDSTASTVSAPIQPVGTAQTRTGLKKLLATPVSGASLALFRIAFGLVMCLEAYSLTQPIGSIAGGVTQIQNYYTASDGGLHFPYAGFGWLPLLGPRWISLLVGVLGLAGLSLAAGFRYRTSAAIVFLIWGYFYAVESTRTYWMSYYYLELLIAFLLIWMPAARRYSVDAGLARDKNLPKTVPYWTVMLLRGQLVITYFYAGIAKLNADWLLDGIPVRYFLTRPEVVSRVEWLQGWLYSPELALLICYAGAFFDLAVGFLLLIHRARILGIVLMFVFHGTNHFILFNDLVWFPLVGVTTALIFLEPDWPERFGRWLRKPVFNRPDWRWLGAGALALPVFGAALGWKFRPSVARNPAPLPIGRWVAPFVVAWLAWQATFPARHYLIPGDARMTFEGLAFSWRLKAEVYRASPAEITIRDPQFISTDGAGETSINWNAWRGDKAIYRAVTPGEINWSELPEVVVLFEPILGERVLYNPLAGPDAPRTEIQAMARAAEIWRENYGRTPPNLRRTIPLDEILGGYATAVRTRGGPILTNRADILAILGDPLNPDGAYMKSFLRRMHPFATKNEPAPTAPFLLIDDPGVFTASSELSIRLDRGGWKAGEHTRGLAGPKYVHAGGEPIILHFALTPEFRPALPRTCIVDAQVGPPEPPVISWDYRREMSTSKQMHISTQPFLLRRYARRVADAWEKEHGRRPAVHAKTALSLNFRPPQEFVDPEADLASVRRKWLGHNAWIRDLELDRIPPASIAAAIGSPRPP